LEIYLDLGQKKGKKVLRKFQRGVGEIEIFRFGTKKNLGPPLKNFWIRRCLHDLTAQGPPPWSIRPWLTILPPQNVEV